MRSVYCVYIDYVSQSISMQLIDCFYWGLCIVSNELVVVCIDYVSHSISTQLTDCFYCGLYIVSSQLIVKFSLRVAHSRNSDPNRNQKN